MRKEEAFLRDLTQTLERVLEVQNLTINSLGYHKSERRDVIRTLAESLYRTGLLKTPARQIRALASPQQFEQMVWSILSHIPQDQRHHDLPPSRVPTVPPGERPDHTRARTGRQLTRTRRHSGRVGERVSRALPEYGLPA